MHLLEDLGLLAADVHAHIGAEGREARGELVEGLAALRTVHDHHHVEESAHYGLGDVENVDVLLGEIGTGLGENPDGILANDGNDHFFHIPYYNISALSS